MPDNSPEESNGALTPRDFRGVAILASAVAVVLLLAGGWNTLVATINKDVTAQIALLRADFEREIGELREDHAKDIARQNLQISCWAKASTLDLETRIAEYVYCFYGKVSKDQVVQ